MPRSYPPKSNGRLDVKMDGKENWVPQAIEKADEHETPCSAKESRFGVLAAAYPEQPSRSNLKESMVRNRTLEKGPAAEEEEPGIPFKFPIYPIVDLHPNSPNHRPQHSGRERGPILRLAIHQTR